MLKAVVSEGFISGDACCAPNPNLSVIWMLCTSSMSSLASDVLLVDLRRLLLPNECTDLSSPEASSWSHWTGSQVGMQGVTRALNWTTSDDGNLNASKYDKSIWKYEKKWIPLCDCFVTSIWRACFPLFWSYVYYIFKGCILFNECGLKILPFHFPSLMICKEDPWWNGRLDIHQRQ